MKTMDLERVAFLARELRECAHEYYVRYKLHQKRARGDDRHIRAREWSEIAHPINERRKNAERELDEVFSIKNPCDL